MSEHIKYSCHKLISTNIWTHLEYINQSKSEYKTNNANSEPKKKLQLMLEFCIFSFFIVRFFMKTKIIFF